jgi:replicative DNA helicase
VARVADEVVRVPRGGDRLPPQNLDAEQSVLGAMMLSAEAMADVVEILDVHDFYRSANGKIYGVLRGLFAHGEPVDIITVRDALRREGILDEIGGALYLRDLAEQVPTPAGAAHYAKIVSDAALRRRLISAAADIIDLAYTGADEADTIADDAEQRIYDVARREDADEMAVLSDLVNQAVLDLEAIQNRESAYTGLPTGFTDLDTLMSGLQEGNLIVIAARPGIGKSSFAVNIARNVAVAGEPVAIFSLEMSRWEIGMRLLCAEARVPWDRIRNKRVGPNDWTAVVQAAETLHDAPLSIVDAGNVNIVDIRAKARRMKTGRRGLSLLIVDYLQLMGHPGMGGRRPDSRQQEIAEISRSLKLLAKELKIPVIAISQLNRNPESRADKRPQLSDLRECVPGDTLVQLADGRRAPIRDLVGTSPDVVAMSPGGMLVEARGDKVWPVGEREVFEVQLASGRTIRATADHRLYGDEGWVRVRDINAGERLAIARRLPEPAETIEWPDDRVGLLGQLIGDGSYLKDQPLRYSTASEENSAFVARVAADEFGCEVKRYRGRSAWHQLLISGNGNRWHPKGVNLWLRELDIHGQRSHEKRIPPEAFRLRNRQIALLLRHLWATDGCIHVRKPGNRGHRVYFASSSRDLADDVAALLLRLGVVSRIRKAGRVRPWWTVDVSGAIDQRWFLNTVGAFGPRRGPAAKLAAALRDVVPNPNVDAMPTSVFRDVQRSMASTGVSGRSMAPRRGTSYGGSAHFAFSPSRWLVAEYAALLHDDALAALAINDVFWDRVTSVSKCGSELVFDLTVPGPASWLAGTGSVISHNSGAIEQDSDVVMFIHRDDADPEKKRQAELIVSKHRNGPTGSIPLNFEPSLTQFRNAASRSPDE